MSERDLRSGFRQPFGPRQPGMWGSLIRFCQWGLTIITVICIWPGVILFISALTDFFPLLRGEPLPPASTLMIYGTWCLWAALLILTAVRLSYGRFRWWVFVPVAAGYVTLATCVMPDASDPEGVCIWQLMLGVAGAQCVLHGLWSLSAHFLQRKER